MLEGEGEREIPPWVQYWRGDRIITVAPCPADLRAPVCWCCTVTLALTFDLLLGNCKGQI